MKQLVLAAILAFAAGCARSTAAGDDSAGAGPVGSVGNTPTKESDWAAIEQLEAQAKAIAKVDGCNSVSECRAAPVGSRACGGPRYYIPYCARTTDSAALFNKLAQVAKAEQAYNRKYQIVSTCEYRMPPAPSLSGGACNSQ
jgi:hypothetical protein